MAMQRGEGACCEVLAQYAARHCLSMYWLSMLLGTGSIRCTPYSCSSKDCSTKPGVAAYPASVPRARGRSTPYIIPGDSTASDSTGLRVAHTQDDASRLVPVRSKKERAETVALRM
eukprot:1929377-Rhodomonas_salina.1